MEQDDHEQFGGERREQGKPGGQGGQGKPGGQGSQGLGNEGDQPTGTTGRDSDLQKEGNLGNERNRNEPDSEQQPGGNRENLNR